MNFVVERCEIERERGGNAYIIVIILLLLLLLLLYRGREIHYYMWPPGEERLPAEATANVLGSLGRGSVDRYIIL